MSTSTSIEWTDTTWNPVRGCTPVSEGCLNCYAQLQAHRFSGPGKPYEGLTKLTTKGPRWTGAIRTVPHLLDEPLRWRNPARVFVNSMSDLFHEGVPFEFIDQVFAVMACCHAWGRGHSFQILTKRPERMAEYLNRDGLREDIAQLAAFRSHDPDSWPLPNVWLGTSVENQAAADERIPHLLRTPAAVRFLSCEPLLGPVDLTRWMPPGRVLARCSGCGTYTSDPRSLSTCKGYCYDPTGKSCNAWPCPHCGKHHYWCGSHVGIGNPNDQPLSWVIVGGESGPGARVCNIAWIESIVEQCRAAGVPVFVKQLGARPHERVCTNCDRTDRELHEQRRACLRHETVSLPIPLRDKKGGDPAEWPEHLRVREFPV